MLDPLSLLPLSLAAHGGRVDDCEAQQLVAAGLTLLQRSAALVRALAGRRSAILLPPSPRFFVALAASEGRGALLVDPRAEPYEIAHQLDAARVGAAFTVEALAPALPAALPRVLLDDAPRSARVAVGDASRTIDLGSHVGLTLEGDVDAPGSDEEAVAAFAPPTDAAAGLVSYTHRALLEEARTIGATLTPAAAERLVVAAPFIDPGRLARIAATLLAGGTVITAPERHAGTPDA